MKLSNNIIGLTMGDPSGVGPEIIIKSLKQKKLDMSEVVIFGSFLTLNRVKELIQENAIQFSLITSIDQIGSCEGFAVIDPILDDLEDIVPGKVQISCGNAAFQYLKLATEYALEKKIAAIVTAPLNKEALHLAGHNYSGHTEILADITNTPSYAMMLYHRNLKVIHVSTHVSLINAVQNLKQARIIEVIELGSNALKQMGIKNPRIGVAGINPHAGENGIFGREEIEIITPVVALMKSQGYDIEGAVAPDTVFFRGYQGDYDLVVAMYHDQGHIPIKMIGFFDGVNITVGLPIIRTSVDHGTAFPIAWQGIADEKSMIEAIKIAKKMVSFK
jgi:4-hydroxythreonine-4-phosphate dehydrogenase